MKVWHAWALVSPRGTIDVDSVSSRKKHVRISMYDELLGCKVKRVRISVEDYWQFRKRTNPP